MFCSEGGGKPSRARVKAERGLPNELLVWVKKLTAGEDSGSQVRYFPGCWFDLHVDLQITGRRKGRKHSG